MKLALRLSLILLVGCGGGQGADQTNLLPLVNVSYANCDAVRAAGAAPIYRGEPGFAKKLDRGGDGIGCE